MQIYITFRKDYARMGDYLNKDRSFQSDCYAQAEPAIRLIKRTILTLKVTLWFSILGES